MNHKEQLISLLGLANSATDEEISLANSSFQKDMVGYKEQMDDAILKARDEVAVANAETTASNERIVSLQNRTVVLLEELANRDVEAFKSVIRDAASVKESLISNRDATYKFLTGLKSAPAAPSADTATVSAPLHNRNRSALPASIVGDSAATMPASDSAWIRNRTTEIQLSNKGMAHRDAFHKARTELSIKNSI